MMRSILSGVILSALAATAGHAAGPVDPDWPCVQRKVTNLSPGQFWNGPDLAQAGEFGFASTRELTRVLEVVVRAQRREA